LFSKRNKSTTQIFHWGHSVSSDISTLKARVDIAGKDSHRQVKLIQGNVDYIEQS